MSKSDIRTNLSRERLVTEGDEKMGDLTRRMKKDRVSTLNNESEIDEIMAQGAHFGVEYRKKFGERKVKTANNFFNRRKDSSKDTVTGA